MTPQNRIFWMPSGRLQGKWWFGYSFFVTARESTLRWPNSTRAENLTLVSQKKNIHSSTAIIHIQMGRQTKWTPRFLGFRNRRAGIPHGQFGQRLIFCLMAKKTGKGPPSFDRQKGAPKPPLHGHSGSILQPPSLRVLDFLGGSWLRNNRLPPKTSQPPQTSPNLPQPPPTSPLPSAPLFPRASACRMWSAKPTRARCRGWCPRASRSSCRSPRPAGTSPAAPRLGGWRVGWVVGWVGVGG